MSMNARSLFGGMSATPKRAKKPTLMDMATEAFAGETTLLNEIARFIKSRKLARCLPTTISFESQLELLAKYPREERVAQVKNSILNNYRVLCYEPKNKQKQYQTEPVTKKQNPTEISDITF